MEEVKRTKILAVLPMFQRGGAERAFINICEVLSRKYEVISLTDTVSPDIAAIPNITAIENIKLGSRPLNQLYCSLRTVYLIRKIGITTLITFQSHCLLVLFSRLFSPNLNIIVRESNDISAYLEHTKKWPGYALFFRYIVKYIPYRFSSGIIAISKGAKASIFRSYAFTNNKLHMIYNPHLNERYYSRRNDAEIVNPQLEKVKELKRNNKIIGFVGRFESQKRPQDFIASMSEVAMSVEGVRAVMVGDGPLFEACRKEIARRGLENKIYLTGFLANPVYMYQYFDIFVNTSSYEGIGNTLVEALDSKCKVISYDCPSGPFEILDGGSFGVLVPNLDISALSKEIREALDSLQLLDEVKVDDYLKIFGPDAYLEKISRIIR